MQDPEALLKSAEHLYNTGKWKQAIDVLEVWMRIPGNIDSLSSEQCVEWKRIEGWCWYYRAIKGNPLPRRQRLKKSRDAFSGVLPFANWDTEEGRKKVLSIMNALPLVLWNLGERERALHVAEAAIVMFLEESSAWNTKGLLLMKSKRYDEAVETFEKVYGMAITVQNFRTAGHAMNNIADIMEKTGRRNEAEERYKAALELYAKSEVASGESAEFHIAGVRKKLARLNKSP